MQGPMNKGCIYFNKSKIVVHVIGERERANLVVQLERFFYPTALGFGPGGALALHADVKPHPVVW